VPGYGELLANAPSFIECIPSSSLRFPPTVARLEENLPSSHDYFKSIYYTQGYAAEETTGNPRSLRRKDGILTGSMRCEVTGMEASGVPLDISQGIAVKENTAKLAILTASLDMGSRSPSPVSKPWHDSRVNW
jgi:hypothetical protein